MMRSTPGFKTTPPASNEQVELHDILSAGRTLVDFFSEFAQRPEEFIIYDDGYRRWSYTYRQVGAAARTSREVAPKAKKYSSGQRTGRNGW